MVQTQLPLFVALCSHSYIYNVLMGAARVAAEQGYNLNVIGLHDNVMDNESTMRQIKALDVAGVLTYPRPPKKDLTFYQQLQNQGITMVMVDRYYEEIDADYVVFDEEVTSYEMTRYLIARGHERIALMTHYEVEAPSMAIP